VFPSVRAAAQRWSLTDEGGETLTDNLGETFDDAGKVFIGGARVRHSRGGQRLPATSWSVDKFLYRSYHK
jgi:hypothetical protein